MIVSYNGIIIQFTCRNVLKIVESTKKRVVFKDSRKFNYDLYGPEWYEINTPIN